MHERRWRTLQTLFAIKFNKRENIILWKSLIFKRFVLTMFIGCYVKLLKYKQTALRQILRKFCVWKFHMIEMLHSLCKADDVYRLT